MKYVQMSHLRIMNQHTVCTKLWLLCPQFRGESKIKDCFCLHCFFLLQLVAGLQSLRYAPVIKIPQFLTPGSVQAPKWAAKSILELLRKNCCPLTSTASVDWCLLTAVTVSKKIKEGEGECYPGSL